MLFMTDTVKLISQTNDKIYENFRQKFLEASGYSMVGLFSSEATL